MCYLRCIISANPVRYITHFADAERVATSHTSLVSQPGFESTSLTSEPESLMRLNLTSSSNSSSGHSLDTSYLSFPLPSLTHKYCFFIFPGSWTDLRRMKGGVGIGKDGSFCFSVLLTPSSSAQIFYSAAVSPPRGRPLMPSLWPFLQLLLLSPKQLSLKGNGGETSK